MKTNDTVQPWDHHLWGVLFCSGRSDPPFLIGRSWLRADLFSSYPGEPSRALLFMTRNQARVYCAAQHAKHRQNHPHWRFKPVKVRELVEVLR